MTDNENTYFNLETNYDENYENYENYKVVKKRRSQCTQTHTQIKVISQRIK